MIRRAFCLYAVAVLLTLAGCALQVSGREAADRVVNAKSGYAFAPPTEWTQKTESGALVLTSPDSRACIRINASSQDPHYTRAWMKRKDALAHIEEETLYMRVIYCDTAMQVGGLPATDVAYTAQRVLSQNDGTGRKGRQVLVYGEEMVYDLDLIAKEDAFDAANAEFESLLGSFEAK